jgi:hypothetical protein
MPLAAVAGSVAGSVIQGIAGSKAAGAQQQAAQQASALAKNNGTQAIDYSNAQLQQNQQNQNPYLQAGTKAISSLSGMSPFAAPTNVTEQNDPGYQFRLQQGQKALENSAAARGGLLSGGTAKAINDYAQGSASNEYGNVYNRALQTYQTNANNQFGLAGIGQGAANELGAAGQNASGLNANILGNETNQVNQQNNNAAAARASGYTSLGNAIGGGLSNAGNGLMQISQLNALNNAYKPDQIKSSGSNTWYGYGNEADT